MKNDVDGGGENASEQDADLKNAEELEIESWIDELRTADFGFPIMAFGLEEILTNNIQDQPINVCIDNSGSIFGAASADEPQSGVPQEVMTFSSLIPSCSTSTPLQTSGHILPPLPEFFPNPPSESSQTRTPTDYSPQFTNQNQPFKQQVIEHSPQQPPTTLPSMAQYSSLLFAHLKNNEQMSLDQIRPFPRPVSTIQTRHLQNQQPLMRQQSNYTGQLQQRQHHMAQPFQNFHDQKEAYILMPEVGHHRAQGMVFGEGHRRPQENVSQAFSAPVGYRKPNEFPSSEAWRQYAFRQVLEIKEKYISDILKMHKKAMHLCIQETNMEVAMKYEHAKEFLHKIINFLNMSSADMMPRNYESLYNYMNFIVNYMTSFRNKNGGSSQIFDQIPQQPIIHQPSNSHHRPQMQPNNGVTEFQNMVNFNRNFPSRRPHGRMPSVNGSFQMGSANPLRIGSFTNAQPNVLGAIQWSNLGPNNVSGSSMSLLNAGTCANFPSRQHNQSFNSEKMKQPMHKSNHLTGSNIGQMMSPLGSLLQNQYNSSPTPRAQSWQNSANSVLSAESIARSPFLLGSSSSAPSHHQKPYSSSSSGLYSVSSGENQRQEIPIIAGLFRDQNSINNQVSNMGPPRTPMASIMDTLCTKNLEESQDSIDQQLPLMYSFQAKPLSPKTLGSSINDINSVQKDLDSILDHGEPAKPVDGDTETNFLLKYDNIEQESQLNSIADGEPTNLDHLNLGEELAFLYSNAPDLASTGKRKLSLPSSSDSLPELSDYDFDEIFSEDWEVDSSATQMQKKTKIESIGD